MVKVLEGHFNLIWRRCVEPIFPLGWHSQSYLGKETENHRWLFNNREFETFASVKWAVFTSSRRWPAMLSSTAFSSILNFDVFLIVYIDVITFQNLFSHLSCKPCADTTVSGSGWDARKSEIGNTCSFFEIGDMPPRSSFSTPESIKLQRGLDVMLEYCSISLYSPVWHFSSKKRKGTCFFDFQGYFVAFWRFVKK